MASKRFHIERPDRLRMLAYYAKETPNASFLRMARIWQAARRSKGETRWDKTIFAGFSGTRNRIAEVMRITADNEIVYCGDLRYNLALNYCEQNLRQLYD